VRWSSVVASWLNGYGLGQGPGNALDVYFFSLVGASLPH